MSTTTNKEEREEITSSEVHLCSYAERLDRTADDIVFHEDCSGDAPPAVERSVLDLCAGESATKREREEALAGEEAERDRSSDDDSYSNDGMDDGDFEEKESDRHSNHCEADGDEGAAAVEGDGEEADAQQCDGDNSGCTMGPRRVHHDDPNFLGFVTNNIRCFIRRQMYAEIAMRWVIALESVDRLAEVMQQHKSVRMRAVPVGTAATAGGEDAGNSIDRTVANVYIRRYTRVPLAAIRGAVRLVQRPSMGEWSFTHHDLAAHARELLIKAQLEVLPLFQSPSVVDSGMKNHIVCFGTDRAALAEVAAAKGYSQAVAPQEKNSHVENTTPSGVRIRLSREVPLWMKPFYDKKVVPFLDAKPNTRPVQLQISAEWQIPVNKVRDISNVVKSLRYETVVDQGGKQSFFLRRSVRVLVDETLRAAHGVRHAMEFDMLIESRFLALDIMELVRLHMFLYVETEKDLLRIRGYHNAQPDLVRRGQKLICLPNQRTVLNQDEQRDLKRFVLDFMKKSVHTVRASLPPFFMDDANVFLHREFSNEVELVEQHGEVHLQRSPKKVLQSVHQSLTDWAKSNYAAGPLAFRVDDVFDNDVGQRVKAFAASRNLNVSRVKDGRVVTFTVFVSRNESPDAKQQLPLPPPPPPPQQSPAARVVRSDARLDYPLNQPLQGHHHAYEHGGTAGPQRIDVAKEGQQQRLAGREALPPPKNLYAEIAAGQSPLPGGYTCRYFPQYRQYVLLDHVKRQGFRPEVGEALTSFGAAIASGIQNVRNLVEGGGVGMPGASAPQSLVAMPPVGSGHYAAPFQPPPVHHHHHHLQYYSQQSYPAPLPAQVSYSYASGGRQ